MVNVQLIFSLICICPIRLHVQTEYFDGFLTLYHKTSLSPPVKMFLLTIPRQCFFCGSSLLFMFCVSNSFLSVHCSLVFTCWERSNLFALLFVMFSCVFVTFPCVGLGQFYRVLIFAFLFTSNFYSTQCSFFIANMVAMDNQRCIFRAAGFCRITKKAKIRNR